jgi:hypothetical protein
MGTGRKAIPPGARTRRISRKGFVVILDVLQNVRGINDIVGLVAKGQFGQIGSVVYILASQVLCLPMRHTGGLLRCAVSMGVQLDTYGLEARFSGV